MTSQNDSPSRPPILIWGLDPQALEKTSTFKFSGQGQRQTPVATIEDLVYIISKVPGDVARRRLAEASAATLTRFLGGDRTLADEVHAIADEQARLAETNPNHPARLFGEHVEERQRAAVEWRAQRTLQKQAGAEYADEIEASGFNSQFNHAHVNNRKNQAVIGFETTTTQFKNKHRIPKERALTEHMDKLQLSAHMFCSNVLKRKISEAAPASDAELRGCVDTESARMKVMFAELGVHKKSLIHHEKKIKKLEKTMVAQKKAIESKKTAPLPAAAS